MTSGGQKRTRLERVAALGLPPGQWERAWVSLRRRDVLGRSGLALLAAIAVGLVIQAWDPPFAYRTGYTPDRDIVAKVSFTRVDSDATNLAKQRARSQVRYVYAHDPRPLVQLRAELRTTVVELTAKETLADVDPRLWAEFQPPAASPPTSQQQEEQFQGFRKTLAGQENLDRFDRALKDAFAPWEETGLLKRFAQPYGKGNQEEIRVHPVDQPGQLQTVRVSDVLIGDGTALRQNLLKKMESPEVADRLFDWLQPRLAKHATLKLDEAAETEQEMGRVVAAAKPVLEHFQAGDLLVKARPLPGAPDDPSQHAEKGPSLDADEIALLRLEYQAVLARRSTGQKLARAALVVAMVFAMCVLCGIYMRYRQRGPLASLRRLAAMLAMAVITVALARWASVEPWQAEIIPLMFFGMTMAIVYRQELALLLSGVLALILVLALGHGLHEFLLLIGVTTTANLNMRRIRSRSKLIYVGLCAGGVAVLLDVGFGLIEEQASWQMFAGAARNGLWAVAAGFLMTGLLPFVEKLFGVLTDLSLLELGDVAHPLLQQLVRRAPSTYNHSVTVGSIAEAAAESIGARGLLVRVGSYFHDIGKMLKPGYFIENQGSEANRHEALVPAMSRLVIVAHIKDGADLARQHHLPQPIIDLVEQHHGTTLVEFFYERATEQMQSDPNGGSVEESTYRYPGPKPQTKEAGVLMLADNVESASRTLVDPTPKRIESLVREVAERRLHGGQFDETGLTLRELRTIERSMVKSLTAIYHGRLKYPEQKTA